MKNLWCIWCNAYGKSRPRVSSQLRLKYFVCCLVKLGLHKRHDCSQYAIFTIFHCLHFQQTTLWGSGLKQFPRIPCIYKVTKWGSHLKTNKDSSLLQRRKYRASDYILQPFTTMVTSLYIQIFSSGRHTLQTHTERTNGHLTFLQHSTPPLENTLGIYYIIFSFHK